MRTAVHKCLARLALLALSLAVARPAFAEEVFTSVDSAACDDYSAHAATRSTGDVYLADGTYCELPGDVVHWPGTTYSASGTTDGSLTTSVHAEGTARTYTTAGSAMLQQGALAYAVGYADRPVGIASAVEITVSLTVDSLTSSDAKGFGGAWSALFVLLERTLGCSDGSTPVESGGLYEESAGGSAVAPGPRVVVLSAACPAGSTLVGVAQASISLYSSVNADTSGSSSAAGDIRVHSVALKGRASPWRRT
jgi:hypothetical protein